MNRPASPVSRREFLGTAGLVPAALLASSVLPSVTAAPAPAPVPTLPPASKRIWTGLELYSVRTELMRNLPETLKAVSKMGYEAVEFYSPYFQWTFPFAKGVRSMIDDLGLRCLSTHNGFPSFTGETMGRAIELNQILGARQVVLASPPRDAKDVESWKRTCGQLTTAVEQFKTHGLSIGYHNHQAEWKPLEGGVRVMDVIAQNTPPEFILQLDVGTCMEVGVDPVAWIKSNPGRIRSVHVKDWAPGTKAEEKAYRVLFGEGVSPWKEIVAAAESVGGVELYLIEQEGSRYPELETAERCLAKWKAFRAKA